MTVCCTSEFLNDFKLNIFMFWTSNLTNIEDVALFSQNQFLFSDISKDHTINRQWKQTFLAALHGYLIHLGIPALPSCCFWNRLQNLDYIQDILVLYTLIPMILRSYFSLFRNVHRSNKAFAVRNHWIWNNLHEEIMAPTVYTFKSTPLAFQLFFYEFYLPDLVVWFCFAIFWFVLY